MKGEADGARFVAMPQKTEILLERTVVHEDPARPERGAATLEVRVSGTTGIAPEIFVWQRDVESRWSPDRDSFYYAVASVHDMDVLEVGEPQGQDAMERPFWRSDSLELSFPRTQDLEEFWERLARDVADLAAANDHARSRALVSVSTLSVGAAGAVPAAILTARAGTETDIPLSVRRHDGSAVPLAGYTVELECSGTSAGGTPLVASASRSSHPDFPVGRTFLTLDLSHATDGWLTTGGYLDGTLSATSDTTGRVECGTVRIEVLPQS